MLVKMVEKALDGGNSGTNEGWNVLPADRGPTRF
jgi:hypothetical protein